MKIETEAEYLRALQGIDTMMHLHAKHNITKDYALFDETIEAIHYPINPPSREAIEAYEKEKRDD